jgi:glycosyltransferase involved in cell wall biosynthesis
MTDVLHVISGLGMGGAETMLVQLAVGLRARGLRQHVVSLSGHDALASDLRATGADLTMLHGGSVASAPAVLLGLARILDRLRPRVLQGWMYHGNIAARLAHMVVPGRRGRKLLWNLRASNMDEGRYGRVIRLSALLSRLPDVVVANSQAGAAFHLARGFHPKELMVIGNGIDTARFKPDPDSRRRLRTELGLPDDAIAVIHVARVDPMKDHDTFLAAMARLPAVAAIMVGEGTAALQVPPNVQALGPRRDTHRLYAAADIVASTSAFGEGFSNVLAEGMSAGLIPVATDVGDAARIVGDTGLIVPPRDPDAFNRALAALAALSENERACKGGLARARIVSNYSLDSAVDRYVRLYSAGDLVMAAAGAGR